MRSSPTKSATAFRTISEVSVELDVPQHVLRFWETRFPQIHPLKRGGGRRYYRPEDVELLRIIQRLLYKDGYTIRGVQRLLREHRGDLLTLMALEAVPDTAVDSTVEEGAATEVEADPDSEDTSRPAPPHPPVELLPPPMSDAVRWELEEILRELKEMKATLAAIL